jgi:agmatine/peptidylarginine deiminase
MSYYNRYPAEFEEQSFIQIIFPHKQSDWIEYLEEAEQNFVAIIEAIRVFESCLIICENILHVKSFFSNHHNLHFIHYQTDDTWARDCSTISVIEDRQIKLLDFTFNGWGGKFDASRDNAMSSAISICKSIDFVLEGGAIESNGEGVILTTSQCLKNPNRNPNFNVDEILKKALHVEEIIYLEHGYLAGDDTDSHIDTLARFISKDTIMYLTCKNKDDEHYEALHAMQKELEKTPYTLIALPMTEPIYYKGERLPATYANFLMINGAILVPTYNDIHDDEALEVFKKSFPDREIIPIDCSVLIRQHGSLHCVTMHYPK